MANSIDWGTIAIGALIGVGCRKQIRAAGRVAASTVASLAGVAAQAATEIARETKSPEQAAAEETLNRLDRKIQQQFNRTVQQSTNGQNG